MREAIKLINAATPFNIVSNNNENQTSNQLIEFLQAVENKHYIPQEKVKENKFEHIFAKNHRLELISSYYSAYHTNN